MTSPTDLEHHYDDRSKLEEHARVEAEGVNSDWGSGLGPYYVRDVSRWALQLLADRRELLKALSDALTGWRTCNTTYQHGDATPRFTEHERRIIELQALAAGMGET